MDQVTQQNAALVEEMAAAASSLKSQAEDLVGVVASFKLAANTFSGAFTPAPVRPPAPKKSASAVPVVVAKAAPAKAAADDEWETF